MSRVTYQAMLDGAGDDDTAGAFTPLAPSAIRSRRRDALVTFKARISPRHLRFLDETATARGLAVDQVVMVALDVLIALDLDWADIAKPGDLRDAVVNAAGVRRSGAPAGR